MIKFGSWLVIWTLSTPIFTLCSPIHRIPKRSDRALINESYLTEILKTVKPYRIGAFHNGRLKDKPTETIDTRNLRRTPPKTYVRFNIEATTVGIKLNRKSRHKIQSSGKSFKKFTGIYIPIPATRKLFDSLLLTSSQKPQTSRGSFMEFYYWVDFGKNRVREFKKVKNRKVNEKTDNIETILNSSKNTTHSDFTGWRVEGMKKNEPAALPPYFGFRQGLNSDQKSKYFTKVLSPTYFFHPNISTALGSLTISGNNSPANDKIKFFETYDKDSNIISDFSENIDAPPPVETRSENLKSDRPKLIPVSVKYLNDTSPYSDEETLDFEIDISVYEDENKTKFAVKDQYFTQLKKKNKELTFHTEKFNILSTNLTSKINIVKPSKTDSSTQTKKPMERNTRTATSKEISNYSKEVSCSKYPFVAAYVYEPAQVFCDAASVSRFWLITAATCLSRKDKGLVNSPQWPQERSAFVSYCSEKWWDPHSITYVKDSKIHPQFDRSDRTSQYLYNVGLILVVNAMSSSCIFWSPVPMLSRRLITQAGHQGVVVGWGLDRYDTKSSSDVPKRHLSLYKGTVYSNACPGNFAYSRVKSAFGAEVLENIYCISLPPYFGEELDQLHGGMLLENGQLIGLYLEEERRSFGPQSAQYTGVWKHVKWILQNSRDPENSDNVQLDII